MAHSATRRAVDDILTFDIGGTTIRAGIYDHSVDRLRCSVRGATPSIQTLPALSHDALRARLYQVMNTLAQDLRIAQPPAVSIAFPGPIDSTGNALCAPTLWGPSRRPEAVATRARGIWPSAFITVANDLTAAGYTFMRNEAEDFCIVTVGSGIGHKVFIQGRPVVGSGGRGGEIGHLRLDFGDDAPVCDCGGLGHLGALASGRATQAQAVRLARRSPTGFQLSALGRAVGPDASRVSNELLVECFHAGDAWAEELVTTMARPLGRTLAAIHSTVGVERYVIIGGFANALGPRYLGIVADAAADSSWALGQEWPKMVELGSADDNAGLLGAGRLAVRILNSARP